MTHSGPPEPSTRRELRDATVASTTPTVGDATAGSAAAAPASPTGTEPSPGGGRRAAMIGGLAALGLGAVALAQTLVPRADTGPVLAEADTATALRRRRLSARTATAAPSPTATPGPVPTPTPTPVTPSPGAPTRPGSGSPSQPDAGSRPGAGAPQSPRSYAGAVDRDASYADLAAGESPALTGTNPRLAAGRTYGPLNLPIADTAAARRHVLRRATASSGEAAVRAVEQVGLDTWLNQQLDPGLADPSETTIRSWYPLAYADISRTRSAVRRFAWDGMFETAQAALARLAFSERQVFEQVVDVMANLLHVTTPSDGLWSNAADYHMTVIRAHAYGSFRDMLLAAGRHPAMLAYLDNTASVNGRLNENYGRELLELHTVGVGGGYTEDDVTASATILSGRRINTDTGQFQYEPRHHITGPVTVLDFRDDNADAARGLEVGDAYLRYLSTHPATAATVARKLAVRFVSDTPDPALVERLAQVYLDEDTALLPVLRELFRSPEFWSTTGAKIRRPLEDIVGTVRAAGISAASTNRKAVEGLYWVMTAVGQPPMGWSPPDGYPDVASAWMSASQLIARWNFHRSLVNGWVADLEPHRDFLAAITPAVGTGVDEWIDAAFAAVVGGQTPDDVRAASHGFLGTRAGDDVTDDLVHLAPHYAALLFNSPSFAIR